MGKVEVARVGCRITQNRIHTHRGANFFFSCFASVPQFMGAWQRYGLLRIISS